MRLLTCKFHCHMTSLQSFEASNPNRYGPNCSFATVQQPTPVPDTLSMGEPIHAFCVYLFFSFYGGKGKEFSSDMEGVHLGTIAVIQKSMSELNSKMF